ncbi:MAG: glycogen debranching protein GlgX [Pseudomonadota bacterium]
MTMSLQAGSPYPLGATRSNHGINFALTAPHAAKVELCLFDEQGTIELQRFAMPKCVDGIWHGLLAHAGYSSAPLIYAYRVYGEQKPEQGHRYNPAKVLLDPYAREGVGCYLGQDAFRNDDPTDTAAIALKAKIAVVEETPYDWGDDTAPQITSDKTILYELHVQGLTRLHPSIPENLRGTYAALAHPTMLDHLQNLGITTVNLLPVHHRADEAQLQKAGRANYWGYASIGFFAPEPRYWSRRTGTTAISEFRDMVRALHRRGIEVVLDVVYNHTAETDADGPTLSFRGIDNALYYHLPPGRLAEYENWTGCGNVLKLSEPRVLQMVMDSLRYWVQEMHVDGFRFDLAPILARDGEKFCQRAAFFSALLQDPVLAKTKLIAEPWDIGPNGYQLGNFPERWQEWNDRYRDTMRMFWLRRSTTLGEFAHCLTGSSKVFHRAGKMPTASVNFITAHDGFTLADLVSYRDRHNEANGENNRDGQAENFSTNCGTEGQTENAGILAYRATLKRALVATLFFSQGTPMLLAGDEFGNSQRGNNNAYCQDNDIGWLNWDQADLTQQTYVRKVIDLRARHAVLRHATWHIGRPSSNGTEDVMLDWFAASGEPMDTLAWHGRDCLGMYLQARQREESCLLLFNADTLAHAFTLPEGVWRIVLDSSEPTGQPAIQVVTSSVTVPAHAILMAVIH